MEEKNNIVIYQMEDGKTKEFVAMLDALDVGGKVLVVVPDIDLVTFNATRNIGYARVVTTDNVSVMDLLNVDSLVMSEESVKAITEALK